MMKLLMCSILGILFVGLFFIPNIYADTSKTILKPTHDAVVDADDVEENYQDFEYLAAGFTNSDTLDSSEVKNVISFLKFNVEEMPDSDFMQDVSIDSAELELFIQTIQRGDADRLLVTVSYCIPNEPWSESKITWNEKPCEIDDFKGEDTVLVEREKLPAEFSWDVTRSVTDSKDKKFPNVTYAISAIPLKSHLIKDNLEEEINAGVVWIWSSERSKLGLTAIPTLSVTHTTTDSTLLTNLISFLTIGLPTIVTITPAAIWFYRRKIKN